MDDLHALRQLIYQAGLSADSLIEINQIVDAAIERGYLYDDERERILAVMGLEIDILNIQSDAIKQTNAVMGSIADETSYIFSQDEKDFPDDYKQSETQLEQPQE